MVNKAMSVIHCLHLASDGNPAVAAQLYILPEILEYQLR